MSEKVLVTPTDVSNLTNSGASVLIDTRDPTVYAVGHLPGAVNIHDISEWFVGKIAPPKRGFKAMHGDGDSR